MNLNVFQALMLASNVSVRIEGEMFYLSRSVWAYCFGIIDGEDVVLALECGQEVDEILDILKEVGIKPKRRLSYAAACRLIAQGQGVHVENGMHKSMGGVSYRINTLRELAHFEEGNKDNFGPCTIHYYL